MNVIEESSVIFNEDGEIPDYVGVEYPANVVNVDKMIETLGGIDTISKLYSESNRRLELRFNPSNIYSKPACGERTNTTNLLMKIKKITRKSKSGKVKSVTFRSVLIGTVKTTYIFNGMCDAHYFPLDTVCSDDTVTPTLPSAVSSGTNSQDSREGGTLPFSCFTPQKLEMHSWLEEDPQCLFLPPAAFSRMDTPQTYFFRGDGSDSFVKGGKSSGQKSSSQGKPSAQASSSSASNNQTAGPSSTEVVTPNVICRTRHRRTLSAIYIHYPDPTPTEPLPEAMEQLKIKFPQRPVSLYEKLKEMFEKRPIWSRNAIRVVLGYGTDNLKYLLPTVAYYFWKGPWRQLWVKFGYDPRTRPDSLVYQNFDLRLKQAGRAVVEAKRNYGNYVLPYKNCSTSKRKISVIQSDLLLPDTTKKSEKSKTSTKTEPGEPDSSDCEEDEESNTNEDLREELYIFKPGTIPPFRQISYQYCDIQVPEVKAVLSEAVISPSATTRCDPKYGWLSKEIDDEVRRIINSMVEHAIANRENKK